MTEAPIPSDPDWMPFQADDDEPVIFAANKEIYKVIGESEDGWLLAYPLNMVLLSKLNLPPAPPKQEQA